MSIKVVLALQAAEELDCIIGGPFVLAGNPKVCIPSVRAGSRAARSARQLKSANAPYPCPKHPFVSTPAEEGAFDR